MIEKHLDDVKKYTNSTFEDGVDKLYNEQAERYEMILKDCVGYADPDMVAELAS